MGRLAMRGVCEKRGRLYFRRKVAGKDQYIRLPALDDPGFAVAYAQAARPDSQRAKPRSGTIAALVAEYRASSDFTAIPSKVTRANRARYLDMIAETHGHRSVKGCAPADVRKMRDAYKDQPGKANNWLATFKALMSYAALNDWRRDNPAREVRLLPIGEHEPWPAALIEQALDAASPMLRLAIVTGLCSGARIADVIRMQHGWHDGQAMEFTTSKTNTDVAIPMHPFWLVEIGKIRRSAVTILYDRHGKPFGTTGALQSRIRTLMASIGSPTYLSGGKPRAYSFHGLRKNAACYLAEMGLADTEIGSICGMTPETVRHYTKRKRALMIARGAADRVTRGDVIVLKGGRATGGQK